MMSKKKLNVEKCAEENTETKQQRWNTMHECDILNLGNYKRKPLKFATGEEKNNIQSAERKMKNN